MNILVTVAGRAGSKGLPGKNMRPFCGKPLVFWSVEHALAFQVDNSNNDHQVDVVVNSDSRSLLALCESQFEGEIECISRPKELAIDEAGKIDVIRYTKGWMEDHYACKYGMVIDLDITNPMRNVYDIKAMAKMQIEYGVDSVLSVVPARRNPYFNQVEGRDTASRLSKPMDGKMIFLRRQDTPKVWDLNCCIYVYRGEWIDNDKIQHPLSDNSLIYTMPDYTFCETDSLMDFELAEWMYEKYIGV